VRRFADLVMVPALVLLSTLAGDTAPGQIDVVR
jgi:hypothetical protein